MSETPAQDQPEKAPETETGEALVRIESVENWDAVLLPATRADVTPPPAAEAPGGFQAAGIWLKLLFPVLILVGYGIFKLSAWERPERRETALTVREGPSSLTGVRPAQEDILSLDRIVTDFVSKLEAHRGRNEWRQIAETINGESNPQIRQHPVVRGFHALARTRLGERSTEIEQELVNLETRLRPEARRYGDLIHGLRLARIDQILGRTRNNANLHIYTDLFTTLLDREPRDPYDVSIRLKLAERYERHADELATEARGWVRIDVVKMRQARSYYQIALRWIVAPNGWLDLVAISPAARPEVERIVEKIRNSNRAIHGFAVPLSDNDSTTWSGRKNTPVHDIPGGSY